MTFLTEPDPRTYAIIGAAIEVHKQLGNGFLTGYQTGLLLNFGTRSLEKRRFVLSKSGIDKRRD